LGKLTTAVPSLKLDDLKTQLKQGTRGKSCCLLMFDSAKTICAVKEIKILVYIFEGQTEHRILSTSS